MQPQSGLVYTRLQKVQQFERGMDGGVGPPGVGVVGVADVAVQRGHRGHAGGAAGFDVAPVVAHIDAVRGGAAQPARRLQQRGRVRFGVRRGVATDNRAGAGKQRQRGGNGQGEALDFVGDHGPGHAVLEQRGDCFVHLLKGLGALVHAALVGVEELVFERIEFGVFGAQAERGVDQPARPGADGRAVVGQRQRL